MSNLYDQILKKEAKIGIIGLGYVGLPIALAFAKKASVVGFDINAQRVELMKKNIDFFSIKENFNVKVLRTISKVN